MGQNRVQTGYKNQSQKRSADKTRRHGRAANRTRTPDMGRLRQAVYELSPLELREYISNWEKESAADQNEEESTPEDLLDMDSELDLSDEDEFPQEYESRLYDYAGYSVNKIDFMENAVLDMSNTYIITVLKRSMKGFKCSFEGPDWFYGRYRTSAYEYILKLRRLIEEIALWFEEEHQAFLSDPTPGSYALGAEKSVDTPCILQSGFTEIMNQRLSEYKIDKTMISRARNNIWLLWDKFSMPLETVFSEEFKMAWVMEKCIPAYKNNNAFLQQGLVYNEFSREDLKSVKIKKFETLDPEQRLRVLCSRVNLDKKKMETVFNEICLRIGIN